VILTYRYRLLPSKRQHEALTAICEAQRQLYNAALEERIDCYRKTGKGRSCFDQQKSLTICRRELPEMAELPVTLQRWTLRRLDDAYSAFFRRAKERSGKAGFPRFRGRERWDSFGFAEFSGIRFDGKRLRFAGMFGGLRIHLHRRLPDSTDIRSCVFRRDGRGWHVCLQVAIEAMPKRAVGTAVGIDLGLKVFAYCSDGVVIPNPHVARKAERKMRMRQRALARCKRGSNRRRKIKAQLVRLHHKITNKRSTWLHQQSRALVDRTDLIAAEDLRVANMVRIRISRGLYLMQDGQNSSRWSRTKLKRLVRLSYHRSEEHFAAMFWLRRTGPEIFGRTDTLLSVLRLDNRPGLERKPEHSRGRSRSRSR